LTNAPKNKILVVDDDTEVRQKVKVHLEKLGYEVVTAVDGPSALKTAKGTALDLIVLDINFPRTPDSRRTTMDGLEVLQSLRESGGVPILMLSSTNISAVKVMALTIGADDYVSKPFDLTELTARIEAILRRSQSDDTGEKVLHFRRLRVDPGERRVWKDDVPIDLTGVEFDLLHTLARRPNHVFTREKLLELAWKEESYSIAKAVDVHIGHIRKKIEDNPSCPTYIQTVRGTGYRFEDTPE
jgi:DNA-binding response OmpR family regulator